MGEAIIPDVPHKAAVERLTDMDITCVCAEAADLIKKRLSAGRPLSIMGDLRNVHWTTVKSNDGGSFRYEFRYCIIGGTGDVVPDGAHDRDAFLVAEDTIRQALAGAAEFEGQSNGLKCGIIWRRDPNVYFRGGRWFATVRLAFVRADVAAQIASDLGCMANLMMAA